MMERARTWSAGAWKSGLAALAAAFGVGLFAAAPAQARNEFENGFEDQIGRLLAYEVFHLGRHVVYGAYGYRAAGPPGYHHGYAGRSRRVVPPPRVRPRDHVVYERYEYERRAPGRHGPGRHARRAYGRF